MKNILLIILIILKANGFAQSNWVAQNSGTDEHLYGIHFIDENTGFIVGGGNHNTNVILKTTNGGTDWGLVYLTNGSGFKHVTFINSLTGFVSGISGVILKTTDCGSSWTTIYTGTPIQMSTFINNNSGWVLGNNTTNLLRTINSGGNWITQSFGVLNNEPKYIRFLSSNTGFSSVYVNGDGRILKTTTGGSDWNSIYFMAGYSIRKMAFPTAYDFYGCGTNGNIIRTNDAGISWNTTNISPGIIFESISMPSKDTGYICGQTMGGAIAFYKTVNSGVSWNSQQFGSGSLIDVYFINNRTGWCSGSNGQIWKTTTGGIPVPVAPILVSPANNSSGISLTPTMLWNIVGGASSYKIQISKFSSFIPLVDSNFVTSNQYAIPNGKLQAANTYFWRVAAINEAGTGQWSTIWNFSTVPSKTEKIGNILSDKYLISQNYPNPFNPSTKIKFEIPKSDMVVMTIYDISGKDIAKIINNKLNAGSYETEWNAEKYPSGLYFAKIQSGDFTKIIKMTLLK